MELERAREIAEKLARAVAQHGPRVEIAGSIRREKPTVKDIELVAIVTDYDGLYQSLARFGRFIKPGVPNVVDWPPKRGAKYVRMLLDEGIKLDLFIAHRDNWGALLCMRTGSAVDSKGDVWGGFIPAMFKRFKQVSGGGKMVGCQPTLPDGTRIPVREERDFFEVCKVKWVEPKSRVDAKAIKRL